MSNIIAVLKRIAVLFQPPTTVLKTRACLERLSDFLNPSKREALVLNLGSGSTFYGPHVINLDNTRWPHVNVVGDAHALPFQSSSLDTVFCQAVLEHVRRPDDVVEEVRRVLKPGGEVYVDVPFSYPYHDRIDFQRYTQDGLRELFRDFEVLDVGVSIGPATAMIQQIQWTLAAFLSLNNKILFHGWGTLFGWLLFPLRYLNLFLADNRFAWRCATAYYLVARKVALQETGRE